jgi:adenine phosphoribosyltransferase
VTGADLSPQATAAMQRLLWSRVREVPDWPEPGVLFRDLTPLMADPAAFAAAIDLLAMHVGRDTADVVVGIEARGFPYGAALAHHLSAGFVTMRKPGKLPGSVHSQDYDLEYGSTSLELHQDAVGPGSRVVIVDDVLATGGTASAAVELVRRTGAHVAAVAVVLDLPALGGRERVSALGADLVALLDAGAPVD